MESYTEENKYSAYFLLAQFYENLIRGHDVKDTSLYLKIIDNFLNAGFSINQIFPGKFLLSFVPTGIEYTTALHFVCSNLVKIDFISGLLDRNAEFTLKNSNQETVIHQMFHEWHAYENEESPYYDNPTYINFLLSAHIKYQNISNPRDGKGFSHLHIACIMNHIEAVKFFLQHGESVDQLVSIDADVFAGYTSLHFAAEYTNIEVVKILLEYGASVHFEDPRGMTPFHILIQDRLRLRNQVLYSSEEDEPYKKFETIGKIISLLLEKDYSLNSNFPNFYAACTLKDISLVERILNQEIDINYSLSMNSQKWPGYTALHFAVDFRNTDVVEFLFEHGANIVAEDANGITPLSMCFKQFSFAKICSMLQFNATWENTLMTDGKTKLLDLMLNMKNIIEFRSFLSKNPDVVHSAIPTNSLFWPGYTLLHLAIAISVDNGDNAIITECLDHNLNVNLKNAQGQTPIHLAFRLQKHIILLLQYLQSVPNVRDILDKDNLSYLHIACAQKDIQLVEKLLLISNPNVVYTGRSLKECIITGWTPLHIAIRNPVESIIKMLVNRGANINASDVYGMTPIHWIFKSDSKTCEWVFDMMYVSADLKYSTTKFGLNYLHVAAYVNNKDVIEKLVRLGSNINAVVNYREYYLLQTPLSFLASFNGWTPLEVALDKLSYKAFVGLLENGAKMSAYDFKFTKHLQNFNSIVYDAFARNVCHGEIENYTAKEIGFTKLHATSIRFRIDTIEKILNQGTNVNTQIHINSKAFPGCTALHLLMIKSTEEHCCEELQLIISKIHLFLDKGADVTLANVEGNTPIHLAFEIVVKRGWSFAGADKYMSLLMAGTKDFSVNPINNDGITHFHAACLDHNIYAVEEFLQHGVDVNQPIGLSCKNYAKCTPLHLAFKFSLTKFLRNQSPSIVVNLLLKSGADVHAEDTQGNTSLHEACRDARANADILENLINQGADVKKENLLGQTPFEILLSSPDVLPEQIKVFIKKGCQFNNSNRLSEKGYIAIFISSSAFQSPKTTLETIMRFANDSTRDEMDRTVMHNTVTDSNKNQKTYDMYRKVIDWFLKKGINIDEQDKSGKTALHYAAQFENNYAIIALLELGADMTIVDKNDKSAFSYAFECCSNMNEIHMNPLLTQIRTRQLVGLENNKFDDKFVQDEIADPMSIFNHWFGQFETEITYLIERSKNVNVGSGSLILHDFLSDKKVVRTYAFMPKKNRDEVDDYFDSLFNTEFFYDECMSTLFLSHYRIAVARLHLNKEAARSLRSMLGFSFPGLCEEILVYLSKLDLTNLIKAAK